MEKKIVGVFRNYIMVIFQTDFGCPQSVCEEPLPPVIPMQTFCIRIIDHIQTKSWMLPPLPEKEEDENGENLIGLLIWKFLTFLNCLSLRQWEIRLH